MAGIVIDLANAHMSGEIVWGKSDCCTGACNIFRDLHGIDPMWPLRGTYRSRVGAYHQIASRGGWVQMATDLARTSGLNYGSGAVGEIGLTKRGIGAIGDGRMLAISAGELGWILRSDLGYVISRDDVVERSWVCPR